jgi:hypothetical protein
MRKSIIMILFLSVLFLPLNQVYASMDLFYQIPANQLVQPEVKEIPKSTLEWTLYKTINLTPNKPVKINIPATQWQISPLGSFIQFTVEGEDGLYFNENGISGDTISGCDAGNYVIKSDSAGEIKIMVQNQPLH